MALLIEHGELPPVDAAIFADTGAEPAAVYKWLDWLETQLSYPVHRVSGGDLTADSLEIRRSGRSGKLYLRTLIPAFVKKTDGKKGILGRKCTADYKIRPIIKKYRELLDKPRIMAGSGLLVTTLIGISTDEAHRMKPAPHHWVRNEFPLIDLGMSRTGCHEWMALKGYPQPPRSACTYCPFHSDHEWQRLTPGEFTAAIQFERDMQAAARNQEALEGVPYLHDSLVPLDQVVFSDLPGYAQLDKFGAECEGLCGV